MSDWNPRCVVVGAGTVGASCAWHLKRRGAQVTLIDSELPGMSTSYGNAGCISPSHVIPFSYPGVGWKVPGWLFDPLGPLKIRWQDLPRLVPWLWRFWRSGTAAGVMRAARAQKALMDRVVTDFDQVLSAIGASDMRRAMGVIVVYDRREHFEAERWQFELLEQLDFEWEYLSPAELRIMVPALDVGTGMAIYLPDWQHVLSPAGVTARIAEACFGAGGEWLQDRVRSVRATEQGVTVGTEGGRELRAEYLVIAAGVWSNALARQLDYTVPVNPKRGYHSMIAQPGVELDYPIESGSRHFVMTPMAEGLRLAGTAEFAALDAPPDYRRARVLREHAQRYLPGIRFEGVTEWMGQRPMTPDSIPIISGSPGHRNVFYAFGHGHYGLTQGPTTGDIITRLVFGEEPGLDLSPYRFDRFHKS